MAEEVVKKAYEDTKRNFGGFLIGVKTPSGEIGYTFHSKFDRLNSLQAIRFVMTDDMYKTVPEIVYVAKVKMIETEKGLEPTLEIIDMSKVELEKQPYKLSKKSRKRYGRRS